MTRKLLTITFELKPNENRRYYFSESFGSIPHLMASEPVGFLNVSEFGFDIINGQNNHLSVKVYISNEPFMFMTDFDYEKK